jgi:hypothetical protein
VTLATSSCPSRTSGFAVFFGVAVWHLSLEAPHVGRMTRHVRPNRTIDHPPKLDFAFHICT